MRWYREFRLVSSEVNEGAEKGVAVAAKRRPGAKALPNLLALFVGLKSHANPKSQAFHANPKKPKRPTLIPKAKASHANPKKPKRRTLLPKAKARYFRPASGRAPEGGVAGVGLVALFEFLFWLGLGDGRVADGADGVGGSVFVLPVRKWISGLVLHWPSP